MSLTIVVSTFIVCSVQLITLASWAESKSTVRKVPSFNLDSATVKAITTTMRPNEQFDEVSQTDACGRFAPEGALYTYWVFEAEFKAGRRNWLNNPQSDERCYTIGQKIPVIFTLLNETSVFPRIFGQAEIQKIYKTTVKQYPGHLLRLIGFPPEGILDSFKKIYPKFQPDEAVYFIVFNYQQSEYPISYGDSLPPAHHLARVVNRAFIEKAKSQQKSFKIVDIRGAAAFSKGHLAGAENIPYTSNPSHLNRGLSLNISELANLEFHMKTRKFNVNESILVYGDSPYDFRPYFALGQLTRAGFKNLFWLYGGWQEWTGNPYHPPENDRRIKVINDASGLQRLAKENPVWVDTRRPEVFRRGTFKGARNVPYLETLDPLTGPKLRGSNLTYMRMIKGGDTFRMIDIPLDKRRTIIFFGQDRFSWPAYKATIWATERGWKSVYWFRPGYQGRNL